MQIHIFMNVIKKKKWICIERYYLKSCMSDFSIFLNITYIFTFLNFPQKRINYIRRSSNNRSKIFQKYMNELIT